MASICSLRKSRVKKRKKTPSSAAKQPKARAHSLACGRDIYQQPQPREQTAADEGGCRLDSFMSGMAGERDLYSCREIGSVSQPYWVLGVTKPPEGPQHQQQHRRQAEQRGVEEEEDEHLLVVEAHAVVDPRAVVIHPKYTHFAGFAVVCPWWLPVVVALVTDAGLRAVR
mmetsp:Transcript_6708/g.19526  ORF Transcript_6708/g.19526 Transcript_6708/m.19526 type:complete len:170 (-) Transcript_6708:529-1038(-)